jgi:glutamate formiminotransferase
LTTLLAYPNVSEGRDRATIDRIAAAFGDALLDVHSDADHHRSAYTLAGRPGELAQAVVRGAQEAVNSIRIDAHEGVHPRVGAVDVAPIIYLSDEDRGAAAAEALVLADTLATDLHLPVFLYGIRRAPAPARRRRDHT